MRALGLIVICLCVTTATQAQTTQSQDDIKQRIERARHIPDPALGEHWQDWAKAHHWSQADIDAIDRDKISIGREQFKQVFTPYVLSGHPLFITSDSLLNAYHVLLEESVRRVEVAHVGKLLVILQDMWKELATVDTDVIGDPALTAAAKRRAQVTVAVALTLLGDGTLKLAPDLATLVDAEVKKVKEAKAVEKPGWLGPPTPDTIAIDYARFTPRGFYTESPLLENYFRAVAWLQAIPFRIDDNEQLLSAAMLASSAAADSKEINDLFGVYDQLLGKADCPDLPLLRSANPIDPVAKFKLPGGLATFRKDMLDRLKDFGPTDQINDQLRLSPAGGKLPPTIRIISAPRVSDAMFFEHVMATSKRSLPSGLDVAAALGSDYAARLLPEPSLPHDAIVDPAALRWGNLYDEYLSCLQALLAPPDKDVPKLFSSPAWQAKSCQTALAGWAQLRHTWQLQAKESLMVFGEGIGPAGFVEPVPDFYQRMAKLCDRTNQVVQKAGLDGPDFSRLSVEAHELVAIGERQKAAGKSAAADSSESIGQSLWKEEMRMAAQMLEPQNGITSNLMGIYSDDLPGLKILAADFDKGVLPANPEVAKMLKESYDPSVGELWHQLQSISLRLHVLANKQLRGVDLNKDDNGFVFNYGAQIANVMLYRADAYLTPRDDAPRIADVYRNPKVGQYLEVGIGRPQSLYILYPYHGGEVLCEGAVMPYYEFPHDRPMTDADWRAMLDSKPPPKPLIAATQP